MNLKFSHCAGLLLCGYVLAVQSALALPVSGLYVHEVPVADQSETERLRGFQDALAAVIVKVTGDDRWLENSAVRQALDNARNLVQEIQFRNATVIAPPPAPTVSGNVDDPLPGPSVPQTFMNVVFDRSQIDRLLGNASIPVWDSNRPSVLVWMVLQDDSGERRLLNTESGPDILNLIQEFALQRGVPVLFPVLDFEDRRTLSVEQLWALDATAIRQASQRYGADSILAGRLHRANSGDLVGLWQFQFQDQQLMFDSFNTSLVDYIYEPLDLVTSRLADHFAVVRPEAGASRVRLQVVGVTSLRDYADIVGFLGGLGIVSALVPSGLDSENLELEVSLLGSVQQLYEIIALDRGLEPVGSRPEETAATLHYRWTR